MRSHTILQRACQRSSATVAPGLPFRSRANCSSISIQPLWIAKGQFSSSASSRFSRQPGPQDVLRKALPGLRKFAFGDQPAWTIRAQFSTSRSVAEVPAKPKEQSYKDEVQHKVDREEHDEDEHGFGRSEKASQAGQLNLSAKLSKDGSAGGTSGGWREVWRLLKIASNEKGSLALAFCFLLVSSTITLSIPYSIGKIMDSASKSEGPISLFGLSQSSFYLAFGTLLLVGAGANYSRIIILRIVGERIVTKLRTRLYRRTMIQNAEFFDANRVGDLISRLGSDTIIVGKSITQNVSDGLRSLVSAVAGFTMMAFMSVKLTGILLVAAPPVAIGAFFYGRAIRNLSRRIQKNLGNLTKIAEERLGNVRTSQAFVGELQEVHRYNNQTRKIFFLGRKEALLS